MSEAEVTDPALDPAPQNGVSIGQMRERFAKALAAEPASEAKTAIVEANARPQILDSALAVYDACVANAAALSPTLRARAIELADDIATHNYTHPTTNTTMAADAAAFASAQRAALAA